MNTWRTDLRRWSSLGRQAEFGRRGGLAWRANWPPLLAMLLFLAFAFWTHAQFPQWFKTQVPPVPPAALASMRAHQRSPYALGWDNWLVFFAAVYFLWGKNSIMVQRMTWLDRLTISLVLANAMFSELYHYALIRDMWPLWFAEHQNTAAEIVNGIRIALVAALVFGFYQLISVPDPAPPRWPRLHSHVAPVLVLNAGILALVAWRFG